VVGDNFTINIGFTNGPGYQLRVLRTEIEDENLFSHGAPKIKKGFGFGQLRIDFPEAVTDARRAASKPGLIFPNADKSGFLPFKKTTMRKTLFFATAVLALASCGRFTGKRIRGNGVTKTEERTVSPFKRVEAGGAIKLMVSQGDLKPVKLEGDENILPYIEIVQSGDMIRIRTKSGYDLSPSNDLIITVTAPVYSSISVSGASDIKGEGKISNPEKLDMGASGAGNIEMEVDAPALSATISGSGSIKLKGQTKDVDIDLSGAGHAYCYDLLAQNTKVDISGAGSAEVYASVSLDADVSGVGNVRYKGNASNVNQHVSGAGSVGKAE
jgi:hypothetical protein